MRTATFVLGTPGHHWANVACSGGSIGEKGLMVATKVLAATAIEMLEQPDKLAAMKNEFDEMMGGRKYVSSIPAEPFILVHGALPWSSSEADYGDVVGPLGKHFYAIALDMIGHGDTTPRGPQDYPSQAQGDFLIHFIDALDVGRSSLMETLMERNYKNFQKRSRWISQSTKRNYNEYLSYKGKHISEWGGDLKIPVLLIWSEPGSRIEWGLSYFFRVPGAEMHLLPWSGHHLFTDQRDRWIQVVTNWLQNEPARCPFTP